MDLKLLAQRSYVPYSGKPGACVVESESGRFFPGVRIENISFPLTIPAVQCGLYACISEGEHPCNLYSSDSNSAIEYWQKEYDLDIFELDRAGEKECSEIIIAPAEISALLMNLLDQSVTIHSNFPVSVVLETGQGYITGVNIESNAWELGLCAERVAIAKAIAYGISGIKVMHIHAPRGEYSSPCGACRQVILEHLPRHPIFLHHPDGSTSRHFSSDLLPYSFKSDFLKN